MEEASVGESVELKCIVSGVPMPDVAWTKDGKAVSTTANFKATYEDGVALLVLAQVWKLLKGGLDKKQGALEG